LSNRKHFRLGIVVGVDHGLKETAWPPHLGRRGQFYKEAKSGPFKSKDRN